ncbi:MAG: isoprenylcysteine carboxylmethyltransferase family protein [Alphaproteobacteria bacterium]|nr:isoprenylcysteine carboxylmethyltransferase family protein [Alphaproteobacteria bacterium]
MRPRQPTWFIALRTLFVATLFTAFWVGGLSYVRVFDGSLQLPDWLPPVGLVAALAGGILCLSCVILFTVRGRGTPAPYDPPRVFVAGGPYRHCRNPMLLGFCIMLAGLAMTLQSPAAVAFAILVFVLGHLMVVAYEEPHLRKSFGQPYLDYCRRVPRWLPLAALGRGRAVGDKPSVTKGT